MMKTFLKVTAALAFTLIVGGCVAGNTVSDKRAAVQKMRAETLAKLYRTEPASRQQIRKSVGYAVFSNVGINLIFFSAGGGWGVARNSATGKDTYMNMASAGLGLGLGVKDFRGVFVFTQKKALEWFIEKGWNASAQADAAAKAGKKGDAWSGAVDIAPGIKLYQITENGLAIQATIQGTKYWKDSSLN